MLGICVVYLVPDRESEMILKLSLRQLSATTRSEYRIYGVALRMDAAQIAPLDGHGVLLPDIPSFETTEYFGTAHPQSGEHIHYLDHLVDHAVRDGCTHIAIFDMDSWPISLGWDQHYIRLLNDATPVTAIVREELQDNFPHPSFTLFRSDFWSAGQSSFGVYQRLQYQEVVVNRISRAIEPGAGIFAALATSNRRCHALLRSNTWNPHFLMCGIYDRRIFHFGAGSRTPHFAADEKEYLEHGNEVRRTHQMFLNRSNRKFFLDMLFNRQGPFIQALIKSKERPK
jgi:hypothetical protein